jgi:hypothetical protein
MSVLGGPLADPIAEDCLRGIGQCQKDIVVTDVGGIARPNAGLLL